MDDSERDVFGLLRGEERHLTVKSIFPPTATLERKVSDYKEWLLTVPRERPRPSHPFKVGVYIRFFNQTKYEDYLNKHIEMFRDTIALCPMWTLVDFYIDTGSSAPHMESSPEWRRLLEESMAGKVDLIVTQKISNVTNHPYEMSICAQILAAQKHPIGIYFISEDLFTLASYNLSDLKDDEFLPSPDWKILPDDKDISEVFIGDD